MLRLSEADVCRLLDPVKLVAALEASFARDYRATAIMPTRMQMPLPHGTFLLMPCADSAIPALGFKSVFVANAPAAGTDRIQASYSLLHPASGELLATIAANHLTDLRTAAVSAIATESMARKNASVLGIFGAGRQARAHLKLFTQVLRFKDVLVCGSTPERSRQFAGEMSAELGISVVPAADSRNCVY